MSGLTFDKRELGNLEYSLSPRDKAVPQHKTKLPNTYQISDMGIWVGCLHWKAAITVPRHSLLPKYLAAICYFYTYSAA